MISRIVIVLAVLLLGSCRKTHPPQWLQGKWEVTISNEVVEVVADSLIFNNDKRSSLFYRYKDSDSTLILRIPESSNTYLHDMSVKIKHVSSNKDTIWFIESDFGTNTFAVKQK